MLLQMSDKCVRDYLLQMDEMFKQSGLGIERFTKEAMPVPQQVARGGHSHKEDPP